MSALRRRRSTSASRRSTSCCICPQARAISTSGLCRCSDLRRRFDGAQLRVEGRLGLALRAEALGHLGGDLRLGGRAGGAREALLEQPRQLVVGARLQQPALQPRRLFGILDGGGQRRVEQLVGLGRVPALARQAVEPQQDLRQREDRGRVRVRRRVLAGLHEQRPVGALGAFQIAHRLGHLGQLGEDRGVRAVHRRRLLELGERELVVALRAGDLGQPLVQVRALPRAPPAGLLDQPRELGARLVVAAAAGEPVGQRQSKRLVLRHETDRLLQHGDGAFEQAEAPVDLRDLGRAREHQRRRRRCDRSRRPARAPAAPRPPRRDRSRPASCAADRRAGIRRARARATAIARWRWLAAT